VIRDFIRAHKLELGYAAAGVVLFIVFLMATFPYTEALSEALAPMGLTLSSSGEQLSFPFGIKLDQVRLADAARGALVESAQVRVTPSLLSLIIGRPGVNVSFQGYGGTVAFGARRAKDATALTFNVAGLHLERYPALGEMGVHLAGTLSATGYVDLSPTDLESDRGSLTASATGASFRFAPATAPVRLGDVTAALMLERGKLVVQELNTSGGEIGLSARGTVELRPDLSQSTLAVRFNLEANPAARARLGFLLSLLPHPPGPSPYFLHGTIAAPLVS
jgi:type II secretion system protein N